MSDLFPDGESKFLTRLLFLWLRAASHQCIRIGTTVVVVFNTNIDIDSLFELIFLNYTSQGLNLF